MSHSKVKSAGKLGKQRQGPTKHRIKIVRRDPELKGRVMKSLGKYAEKNKEDKGRRIAYRKAIKAIRHTPRV